MNAFKSIDKKTLKVLGIGLLVIVLLIVVIAVVVRLTSKTYYSYTEVEAKLNSAAEKYYNDNNGFLPSKEGDTRTVGVNTLVVNGYISSLEDLLKDGDKCNAQVVVTKLATNYEYTAYLDCGEAYNSIELYNKILEDNAVVTEGVGLYSENNEKVFKGEVKNNYIMLNENLWRILRIDEDNNVVLLSHFKTNSFLWDNRYNEETLSNNGINDYNISRLKDSVEDEYYNGELLTDNEKSKLVSSKWCLGARKSTDTLPMKDVECLELTEKESPIGLLTVYEYLQASLDPNCKTIEDRGCTNYNYIHDMKTTFWTITKGEKNSSYAYSITTGGVSENKTNSTKQVRYVVKLSTKTIYSEGSGTETDPYKIR